MLFFRLLCSAEANQRLTPCFVGGHPALEIFFDG
jgi:hypothetical protein